MDKYPTKLKLFKAWAKAMEEGATVDRPNYGKSHTRGFRMKRRTRRWPRKLRKRRLKRRNKDG